MQMKTDEFENDAFEYASFSVMQGINLKTPKTETTENASHSFAKGC